MCVPRTDGLAGQSNSELATLYSFHTRNGLEDPGERATPADVAVEAFLNLFGRRVRILLKQSYARHDESRRAEAAHQRVLVAEGLLHGMQLAGAGKTIHAANLLALYLDRQRRTGVDRFMKKRNFLFFT